MTGPTAPELAYEAAPATRGARGSRFGALYGLFLRTLVTRGRVAALVGLGLVTIVVAAATGYELADGVADVDQAATDFVNGMGLSLLVPVTSLVFASAAFGDLRDDETTVYLWLRPVPRGLVVAAGYAASCTITVPVVAPLGLSALLIADDPAVVAGSVAASALGAVTYSALFLALGLRVRRSLVWGLAYILIWEGFVAQAGETASRLAIRAYTRSVLADLSGTELALGTVSVPWSVVVPLGVTAAALAYAVRRFQTQDVA